MQTDSMNFSDPSILWPAPGYPALLDPPHQHLDMLVAFRNLHWETLRSWAEETALWSRSNNAVLPLSLQEIAPAEPQEITAKAAQFAALPKAAGLNFARLNFRMPRLADNVSDRSLQLYDIRVRGDIRRSRSVAVFHKRSNTLNIAFASDLHVAHLWNEIRDALDRHAPELARFLPDPHSLLDRFIDEANALAADGDLDLVVLGGDLVDHVHRYARADKRNGAGGNVHLLLSILDRLEVPTLMIPGNHDYRSYPRRHQSSGLDSVGLSRSQTRILLRRSRLWDRWPLAPGDLDSLRTMDAAGNPALCAHLMRAAPATDYGMDFRGLRLLLLSSGCDILARWREVEPKRLGLLVRGLGTARHHPDSEGFSDTQLGLVRDRLRDAHGAALFSHAPLLAPAGEGPVGRRIDLSGCDRQDSLQERVRFEKKLLQAGLRRGVSFRNPGPLLEMLASATGPVAAFSGHVHCAGAIEIECACKQGRFIRPDQAVSGSGRIALITAPALGQRSPAISQPPGYLLVRFTGGALVSLERRALPEPSRTRAALRF
jgi:hypothetical protein